MVKHLLQILVSLIHMNYVELIYRFVMMLFTLQQTVGLMKIHGQLLMLMEIYLLKDLMQVVLQAIVVLKVVLMKQHLIIMLMQLSMTVLVIMVVLKDNQRQFQLLMIHLVMDGMVTQLMFTLMEYYLIQQVQDLLILQRLVQPKLLHSVQTKHLQLDVQK